MAVTIDNPTASEGVWLRGNLHGHSTFSDGSRPFEDVLADYEARGYDFLAMTDHDIFVDPADYADRTTLTLIPGVEVSRGGPHILQLDATGFIEPDRDRQVVVDNILAQNAIAVINHPNWGHQHNHCPHEVMETLEGYTGLEIYNGVIEWLPGSPYATDRWDRLLSAGRRVWGFVNDDSHRPENVELGWNVARVAENTREAIVAALKSGSFYGSTGVEITDIQVVDGKLCVETVDAQRIAFFTQHGVRRQATEGRAAAYALPESDEDAKSLSYVRAECYGAGGRTAWTQPIFFGSDG